MSKKPKGIPLIISNEEVRRECHKTWRTDSPLTDEERADGIKQEDIDNLKRQTEADVIIDMNRHVATCILSGAGSIGGDEGDQMFIEEIAFTVLGCEALVNGKRVFVKFVRVLTGYNEELFRSVEELELSVRSANCLQNANIQLIGELVQRSEQDMLKRLRGSRKSLKEIKEILSGMGLNLGMKIDNWDQLLEHYRRRTGTSQPVSEPRWELI
jgi:DNA-directed RNA polymerase alpha subunit